jgi:molybdopterin molybdotransferase
MLSFDLAQKLILARVVPLPATVLPLLAAANMVAAETVTAGTHLPAFDNSAMDGYAVRTADCLPQGELTVGGAVMAGESLAEALAPGMAVKIMTGAPIPPGFDAVIPFEEIVAERGSTITLPDSVTQGQHIRFIGEDIRVGEPVVSPGVVIRPAEINILASLGVNTLAVHRRVRVAILSTGDELVEAGTPLLPGSIVNSNAPALAAAVSEAGGEPTILGIARDTRASLLEKISAGLAYDVLVTTAGVSAGERDLVREVLEEVGVTPGFWKVAIKPGGPTAFGMKGDIPVFSLPGNPVSALLTFEEFVRPALLRMMGHRAVMRPYFTGILAEDVTKKAGKANLLRVKVTRDGSCYTVRSAGNQQTGLQRTLMQANAVALLPPEATSFRKGEQVDFHFLHDSALLV